MRLSSVKEQYGLFVVKMGESFYKPLSVMVRDTTGLVNALVLYCLKIGIDRAWNFYFETPSSHKNPARQIDILMSIPVHSHI